MVLGVLILVAIVGYCNVVGNDVSRLTVMYPNYSEAERVREVESYRPLQVNRFGVTFSEIR